MTTQLSRSQSSISAILSVPKARARSILVVAVVFASLLSFHDVHANSEVGRNEKIKIDRFNAIPQGLLSKSTLKSESSLFNGSTESLVQYRYYSFLSSDKPYFGAEENSTQLSTVGLLFKGQQQQRIHFDGGWIYSQQEVQNYVNISELSYGKKISIDVGSSANEIKLWLGRHKHEWSQADDFWQMGLWQPRFMWNKMDPTTQGLTGVFYEQDLSEDSQLVVFGTYLFLPDMGPSYNDEDGKISSVNPWFKTPPPIINLWDNNVPVWATVKEPSEEDVVFQPSLAVQYRQRINTNWSMRSAYAYKPIAQPLITYEYYLRARADGSDMVLNVWPEFPYEHILTFENFYRPKPSSRWSTSLSYQKPEVRPISVTRIGEDMEPALTASMTREWDVETQNRGSLKLYSGLIKVWESPASDRGENAQGESQFERRKPYYFAAKVGANKTWALRKKSAVRSKVEALYDESAKSALGQFEVQYDISQKTRVGAHIHFLGSVGRTKSEFDKTFLRSYRANDTVGVDVSHVF